jgi:ubiquinone/menaquinone biosynthesis C-methylase UbiE
MPPNRRVSIARYRTYAPTYDKGQARNPNDERQRMRVVALLRLQPGDTVLDVGCGTGLSFPLISDAIGPDGTLIGIDQSPDMLAQARERVAAQGWQNVTLIQSPIEDAAIPTQADALLFSFAHDILQTPAALENVFRHAKPGARVASAGFKWAPLWALPWSYIIWNLTRRSVTTRENFGKPWRNLSRYVPDVQVETTFVGAIYFAWGTAASRP